MSQDLSNIKLLIQQSALSDEEKQKLFDAILNADKQWKILEFKLDRTEKVKKTTAILLEETIAELEQKRKAVEAQNRELEIESALERVRTVAMSMNKTDDVLNICKIMFTELKLLGFGELRNALINFWDDEHNSLLDYDYSDFSGGHMAHIPYNSHPTFEKFQQRIRSSTDAFAELIVHEDELESWKERRRSSGEYEDPRLENIAALYYYFYSIGVGAVGISTFSSLTEEKLGLLKRFRNVFDLAYRRYMDIQKAEAQAREAQIEVALEKIRSRSLGMHRSDEIKDVVAILFEKLKELGLAFDGGAAIHLFTEGSRNAVIWVATTDLPEPSCINLPYDENAFENNPIILDVWKAKETSGHIYNKFYSLEEKNIYFNYVFKHNDFTTIPKPSREFILQADSYTASFIAEKNSLLGANSWTGQLFSDNDLEVLKRIARVFEQAYIRFLDLQKAEAQAREAQIEASLEKVRSKAMMMLKSEDLSNAVAIVFEELDKLNLGMLRCGIGILDKKKRSADVFTTTIADNDTTVQVSGDESMDIHPLLKNAFEAWLKQEDSEYILEGSDLNDYYKALTGVNFKLPQSQSLVSTKENIRQYYFNAIFPSGGLFAFSENAFAAETKIIMKRFANVFEQTYTRFLDLQKAEAQAREARIEAAMEKVRSRALAMQKPNELVEVAELLRKEMGLLGVEELETSSIYIHHEDTGKTECWYAIKDATHPEKELVSDYMTIDLSETWVGRQMLEFYRSDNKRVSISMQGANRKEWINYCADHSKVLVGFYGDHIPDRTYHLYKFSNGYVGAASPGEISTESWDLLQRATSVFSLAYTRFSDLQQAEAQAKEAKIEAALERVRSRTLAMQHSDELAETAAVLFKQLIGLGIAPNRLYIGIINDDSGAIEFWITDEDGTKVSTMFSGDAKKNASVKKMYDGWLAQKKSIVIDMQGKELADYFHYLGEELNVPFKDRLSQKRRLQYISYFSKGFIGMASPGEQPQETIDLIDRFAYVFNLTFTRFNDLKIAEAHALQAEQDLIEIKAARKKAEDTLSELQATQRQLIQSEKMASLGELTAGIAHEIQNPLNFVNNFSEVNGELISELVDEVDKGNSEEVKVIANDIKQNLEKINHHGKRADAIVKGMLQHSRISTGIKEPTDINALCDEYLRLSYHGLRAKDKSFNADYKTAFDETIGKINVVPQDIGRVLLNLFNNAFYATNEKLATHNSQLTTDYKPLVSVQTKKINDKIEIRVADNGNGIPQNIIDKIFQPFFTTKPTGQGTGLGLSLAYDIVKAHGGEIKVETKEGERSAFIIKLPTIQG